MKKLFISISILLACVCSLWAEDQANPAYVTRNFDFKNFTELSVSSMVEVKLSKSDTWKVSINLPGDLDSYLDVRMDGNELRIGMRNIPAVIQRKLRNMNVTATVSMPELRELEVSGAASVTCNDTYDLGDKEFSLELSGAGKLKGMTVNAKKLDLEMGGASSAELAGVFDTAEIEMGGASKGKFDISAAKLIQEISGASKANHSGSFTNIDLEATGACVFSFKGNADNLTMEVSGGSKVEVFDAAINDVKARISGASYCEVNAQKALQVDASGASSLRYADNESMKLNIRSISRGASVSKAK